LHSLVGQITGMSPRVSPNEGRLAIVTNVRWDAVDATLAKTNAGMLADGEVVWSWRPGAGAKFREKQASQG
jgi:hypothetical protein